MSGLRIFQSFWATEARIPGVPEKSVGERFDRVRAAGFDGLSLDLGAISLEEADAIVPHYARTGLRGLVTAFPRSIEDLRPAIRLAQRIDAPFVIVVGQVMPLTVADSVPVIEDWLALAQDEGMPIQFETHRGCITNDLFATLQLLDAVPAMRVSADLSHYVVDRELELPVPPEMDALFRRVLDRAESFQGRIATGQHVQVPIAFPQHRGWVELFVRWWEAGFARWRATHAAGEECVFLCELGPTEYAITGADGLELSDRWEEAGQLAAMARACWEAAVPKSL